MVELFIELGVDIDKVNWDGNILLYVVVFMCEEEIVKMLFDLGVNLCIYNDWNELLIDVVFLSWNEGLGVFY